MPRRGHRRRSPLVLGRRRGRPPFAATLVGSVFLAVSATVLPPPALTDAAQAASQAPVDTPDQRQGSADGREHTVSSKSTDATGKNAGDPADLPTGDDALPLSEDGNGFVPVEPDAETSTIGDDTSATLHKTTGFDPGESVELTSERGPNTKVFRNPDGTKTERVFSSPVHYEDDSGRWRDIKTKLVPAAKAAEPPEETAGRLSSAADDSGVTVATSGDDAKLGSLAVSDGEQHVAFGLKGADDVTAEVQGDTAHYRGIRQDSSLTLQAQHGMLKEEIVLKSPDAPRVWTFPLQIDGLTPELSDEGAVLLRDTKGAVQAVIPTGWMEDSSHHSDTGGPAISSDVQYSLTHTDSQWALEVTLDDTWLSDPKRVYPVRVDPTLDSTQIESYGDAFVQDDWPNDNFGGDDELKVGSYDAGGSRAMSYVNFDNVTDTLKHHYILNADLYLYNVWSSSCTDHEVRIHQVTEGWHAGTVTWNNRPSTKSSPVATASFAYGVECGGADWGKIDLGEKGVELVQGWVDGSIDNNGLSLQASFSTSGPWKRFASRNSANPPYLDITYSDWGASYDVGSMTAPLTGGQAGEAEVTVKNLGDITWEATGWNEFRLGARVRDYDSGDLLDAVAFTRLTERLTPGDSSTLTARIPPLPPGKYKVNFDMQRLRDQHWMSSESVPVATVTVTSHDIGPRITDVYPMPGGQVGSLTPALFVDAESVDHYPANGDIDYWFEVCAGTADDPTGCVNSGWVDNRTWTVPDGTLDWGEQYVWRTRVRESSTEGPLSPYYSFVTAVEQPAVTSHLGSGRTPGSAGREVDPRIGNYTTADTDATVATPGPALTVTRTYNSRDPRTDNAFGAGWTTRFDMRVEPDGDGSGNVVLTYPSGRQVRFGKNPDGGYAPPYGSFATLTVPSGGGWKLTDKNQTSYVFDDQGRLTEVTDFRGRSQTMDYDASGRLAEVTAAGGRHLYFTWSGGHVATVSTDPPADGADPLTWSYTYDGDRLAQVCGPEDTDGACTRYTYTGGSHYRTTVRDAGPFSYWRLDEEAGAQTAQSDLLIDRADHAGAYHDVELGTDGAPTGSTDTAATFNGSTSVVDLPDQLVSDTPYLTVELWFRTTGDGVLFSYQKHALDEDVVDKYTPALYVGTDGKLRGELWNGASDPITTDEAVNDGSWHHTALTAAGNVQTLYLDGDAVGSAAGPIVQYDQRYVYLGAGNWNNWPATTGAVGHFAGDVDELAVYGRPLGARTLSEHHAAGTTSQLLTKVTEPSGRVYSKLEYDTVRDRVSTYTDANGGTYRLSPYRLTGTQGAPGTDGQTAVAGDPTITVTVTDPAGRDSSYTYDPLQGHRVISQTDAAGSTTDFDYDTGGFLAALTSPDGAVTRLGHDERGNKVSQTTCRDSGDPDTCHTTYYEYFLDPDDPLDPRNDQLTAVLDARSSGEDDTTYRTVYGYNAAGDRVSTTTPATTAFPAGRTTTNTFTDGSEQAVGGGTVPAGLLATTTDPRGAVTTRAYTAAGDLASVTTQSGLVTKYGHDALGRTVSTTVVSDTHPDGVTSTIAYDGESRRVELTGPVTTDAVTDEKHQTVTDYTYDADGNVLTVAVSDAVGDAATRTTTHAYDAHGRQKSVTDAEGGVSTTSWDVYGHRTAHTTPDGTTYAYSYTPRGFLAETTLKDYTDGESGVPTDVVVQSNAYDPAGRLASRTDAMGRTVRHTYYDDGLPAQDVLSGFHDPDGSTRDIVLTERHYDAAGNLVRQTTGNGSVTTSYEVNAAGLITAEVLDPGGLDRRTAYTYDAGGAVLTATRTGAGGSRTEQVTHLRDDAGRVVRTAVENGADDLITTQTWNQRGLLTSVTSPRGNVTGADPDAYTTDFGYDVLGRRIGTTAPPVTVETRADGASVHRSTTAVGYDAFGEVTATRGPGGHVTRTAYDRLGRPVSTTLPDYTPPGASAPVEGTSTRTYTDGGRLASETDAAGHTTEYAYDQLGNLVSVTGPAPSVGGERPVVRSTYDLVGERLSVTGPTGALTEATYDDLGRKITSTVVERHPTAAAYTTTIAYDDSGNVLATTAPDGTTTAGSWNAAGQPMTVTDQAGGVTRYGYGPTGLRTSVTGPLGHQTRTVYDLAGRVTEITDLDADGTELRSRSQSYDAAGNPVAVTDPLGATTQQSFDALGRLTELIEPVDADTSITTSFGYDGAGHRTRLTDGRGNTTWYSYTSRGLPASVVEPATAADPDLSDRTFTTVYDALNRPVEKRLPGGVTQQRSYDALGRLVKQAGSGAEAETTADTFGYDLAGRLTSASAPGGTDTFTWDDRGHLLTTAGPSGTASFAYGANGRMTSRTDAAGTTTFAYDGSGRLGSVVDPLTGVGLTYGYDDASRLTSVSYGGGAQRTLVRDAFGRVTSDTLTAPDGTATTSTGYVYDEAGRVVEKDTAGTADAGKNTYTYDEAGRLTSWTAPDSTKTAYQWDASGNRVQAGEDTATYDERNRLLTAGTKTYAWSPRGTMASVTDGGTTVRDPQYDALGRMVAVGGTSYAYDGLGRLVRRGETALTYAGLSNNQVTAGGQVFVRGPGGAPLASAAADGSGAALLRQNMHDDVVGRFDPATGALAGSSAYAPFGKVTDSQGTGTSLGYQGGWTDPDTGEVDMHARWYDPSTGGFSSRDSWTLNPTPSIQANRYTYAAGSPLMHTDPTGHFAGVVIGGIALTDWLISLGAATVVTTAAGGVADWVSDNWDSWWSSSSSSSTTSTWTDAFPDVSSDIAAGIGAQAAAISARPILGSSVPVRARPHRGTSWHPRPRGPFGPRGRPRDSKPKPPPPPNWGKIILNVLKHIAPRPTSQHSVDSDHEQYVEDAYERAIKDLELTPDQLRKYFHMSPGGEIDLGPDGLPLPQPSTSPGNGNDSDDDNDPCSRPRSERFYYEPLVQGRTQGAVAVICPDDLKSTGSKRDDGSPVYVPGFPDDNINSSGKPIYNRTHIIADAFHGEWRTENLFTGYDRMNKSGMRRCENKIAKQLRNEIPVFYSGQLMYGQGNGKIPDGIRMTAFTRQGKLFDVTVENSSDWQVTCERR